MLRVVIIALFLFVGLYVFTVIIISEYLEKKKQEESTGYSIRTSGPPSLPEMLSEDDDDE